MTKKTKIIGVATVALLALSPVVVPSIVSAADTATTANNVTSQTTTTSTAESGVVATLTINKASQTINPDGKYFQVLANSAFDPTNFVLSDGSTVKIVDKATIDSNTVDTSKAGSTGTVKLTATDASGKTQSVTFTVFVKPTSAFKLNILPNNLVTGYGYGDIFYQGSSYYVANELKYANGEFYSNVAIGGMPKNGNGKWLPTKYLANSNNKSAQPKLV